MLAVLGALSGKLPMLNAAETPAPAETPAIVQQILQDLRSFNTVATLLHVAAHPDDENTQLITYFARGRGYRTAYLSVTRGDGGQNELGPDFDEKLGLARTQELLAARKLDGGRQFFTRAIDFGYSKSVEETLAFWDRKEVLGDVVRVIRKFRPDVIVTRFSPHAGGTHGHHTASAVLAVEAFKLAGDPQAYPEQLQQGVEPWQPKRVVWNGFGRGAPAGPAVRIDIGGNDPVTGESFASIASRSIGMHKTQGVSRRGSDGPNEQTFLLLGGEPAEKDLFDGIDTTWARVPGGAEIGAAIEKIIADFKPDHPSASAKALLAVRRKLAELPKDPVIDDKRAQLDRILQACFNLKVETRIDRPEIVPGERYRIDFRITANPAAPLKVIGWRHGQGATAQPPEQAQTAGLFSGGFSATLPADTPLTQPYWLREDSAAGIAHVSDPALIGLPENTPALPVEYEFEFEGERFVVTDEPVFVTRTDNGERRRRPDVIPPVSLRFVSNVTLLTPGATKQIEVEVLGARADASGTARIELPEGWKAAPASQQFRLATEGERVRLAFHVTAPQRPGTGRMLVSAEVGGKRYANERIAIDYPHLPLMLLQPLARSRLVSAEVAAKGAKVGYLPGAGDDTAQAIEQLGYTVSMLSGADLTPEKLKPFDAVVIGVRAFNERTDLKENLPGLFAYVEEGGTVIAQYNRPSNSLPQLGPYPLTIGGSAPQWRVTDEKSPVTFLAPDHPALTSPNTITPADFEGWVQERGAYFPNTWDEERYAPILAFNDPGQQPLASGVLIARHGKGCYVYTGLAFFRQLPAGVPGAYRLFANLLSLGK